MTQCELSCEQGATQTAEYERDVEQRDTVVKDCLSGRTHVEEWTQADELVEPVTPQTHATKDPPDRTAGNHSQYDCQNGDATQHCRPLAGKGYGKALQQAFARRESGVIAIRRDRRLHIHVTSCRRGD